MYTLRMLNTTIKGKRKREEGGRQNVKVYMDVGRVNARYKSLLKLLGSTTENSGCSDSHRPSFGAIGGG